MSDFCEEVNVVSDENDDEEEIADEMGVSRIETIGLLDLQALILYGGMFARSKVMNHD